MLNIKVGKILQCQRHENADKLYVSQIQIDEKSEEDDDKITAKTVQVCSGLVNFIPIEQMSGRMVAVLTNLKISKQRGVNSEGMLLTAVRDLSDEPQKNDIKVELVKPPTYSKVGQRLYFHPFVSDEYPSKLKSKTWENIQKRLRTTAEGEAVYVTDEGEECFLKTSDETSECARVDSLTNALIR